MEEQRVALPSEMREKQFLFSVIVPVYNTEEYVEETLESVIAQSIGFLENIQLILVNNATTDQAGEICKRYQKNYPNNVIYIELPQNRGPSGARNAGIPYVRGQYVNFLDSDDKWDKNAFQYAIDFLSQHGHEVTFTVCRKHYFDAWDSWFYDDAHFHTTRVCSIWNEPERAQFWLCAGFFRADVFKTLTFDEDACFSEDMKFLNEELIRCGKYGIVRESIFYYRKRSTENLSQVQLQRTERYWYSELLDRSYHYLVQCSTQRFGKIIPYIQYVLMQEIAWRIPQESFPEDFTEKDIDTYKEKLRELLQKIDDYVILTTPNFWKEYKLACLKLKYGDDVIQQFECRKGKLFFHNLDCCSLDDSSILTIEEHHVVKDILFLDGKINFPFPSKYYDIFAEDDLGNRYYIEEYPGDKSNVRLALGEPCLIKRCFRIAVPLLNISIISFKICWNSIERVLNPKFGKFSKLTRRLNSSYCVDGEYIFTISKKSISVRPLSNPLLQQCETAVRSELKQKGYKRALFLRAMLPVVRHMLRGKKLWILSDRTTRARDNGEHFFRYLAKNPSEDVRAYFVVSKESPDYKRIKQYGKVVPIESLKYQILYLAADAVLSSTWGYAIEDPYGWHRDLVKDLFHYQYIYLDHALTKDDISSDVNKHARNFSMWTTGSRRETESIIHYPYGYLPNVPKTTGLARYDAIYPAIQVSHQKIILIAPTWRKSLARQFDKNGMVQYSKTFRESEFFRFYNSLIHDKRLLECMRKKGYRGVFRLHPTISAQAKDFGYNEMFSIQSETETYESEFFETAMVVTDYSSLAMDYGYIGRPVVYAQFDKEEFYRTHSYHESYFDYEKDGFGPVCYDYESTVQALIDMIEQDCIMDDVYAKRREQFFAYIDNHNCERIFKEIVSVTGGSVYA